MTQAARPADLARAFPWTAPPETVGPERFNVAPTQDVLALLAEGWRMLRWGLVPAWAASPRDAGARYINARAETAASKAPFRSSYRERRCLIPADGFYEWKREGQRRTPFLFRAQDSQVLVLAGLWTIWGGQVWSCSVLTRPSTPWLAEVHDRMPVLVPREQRRRWLQEPVDAAEVAHWEVPLRRHQVGEYVNRVAHEGPECVRAIAPGSEAEGEPAPRPDPGDAGSSPATGPGAG